MKWKQCEIGDLLAKQELNPSKLKRQITNCSASSVIPVKLIALLSPESGYEFLRRKIALAGGLKRGSEQIVEPESRFELNALALIFNEQLGEGGLIMQEQSDATNLCASAGGSNSTAWKISRRIETALLRVPLSIVIGTAEITALRLFEIAKGDLIDFEFDAFSPVKLLLAGETVAAGRLVMEGERIAVEITTTAADISQLKQSILGVNKSLTTSTISVAE